MFNDSVHPHGMFEAVLYGLGGFAYLIVLGILIISLAVVTFIK